MSGLSGLSGPDGPAALTGLDVAGVGGAFRAVRRRVVQTLISGPAGLLTQHLPNHANQSTQNGLHA